MNSFKGPKAPAPGGLQQVIPLRRVYGKRDPADLTHLEALWLEEGDEFELLEVEEEVAADWFGEADLCA